MNRFNPYEGWVGSESVGADILVSGRAAMNRALDGDIVAVELLPEDQCAQARCLVACMAITMQQSHAHFVRRGIGSTYVCLACRKSCSGWYM